MKKTLLTSLLIILLTACQSPLTKKPQTPNNVTQVNETQVIQLNADTILNSLDHCLLEIDCKKELDLHLNDWLIENEIISLSDQIETDEQVSEQNTHKIYPINNKQNTPVLSSHYMNNLLVKGALNEWLTWKRPQLISTWQYYQFLRSDMIDAFEKYQIEEAFILAIMAQESGGKVHSRSRAGAGGLFQLMPATAKRLGLHGKIGAYDLRFNPKQSAKAAAKYISEQEALYQGDETKILAAYNSGENRFARLNKRYKNKSLWGKSFFYELPRETRHYIPVVIAAMLIFQNPEKFNVILPTQNSEVITVQLAQKTSLSELAVCLGQEQRPDGWFRILRNLNSGVKADKSIKAHTDLLIPQILASTFENNCKNSTLMTLAQSLHESDFQGNQGLFRYRVKQGDSLYKIVKKFKCTSKKELARINNLKAPRYLIRAGKYLKVPQC